MEDRGQLYTLEGIFAGLIILLGLLFAIQATTTTPSAAGASNPHAIQDDDVYVQDVLSSMNHSTLEEAVLYWNQSSEGFHCTPSGTEFYTGIWNKSEHCESSEVDVETNSSHPPPNSFGHLLGQRLGDQYSYNVRVAYNDSGSLAYQRMVYQGEPGVGAVRSSSSVVLLDSDKLVDARGETSSTPTLENSSLYDDSNTSSGFYNVVHVEVVIWRG